MADAADLYERHLCLLPKSPEVQPVKLDYFALATTGWAKLLDGPRLRFLELRLSQLALLTRLLTSGSDGGGETVDRASVATSPNTSALSITPKVVPLVVAKLRSLDD
jgi:hypothetical protein